MICSAFPGPVDADLLQCGMSFTANVEVVVVLVAAAPDSFLDSAEDRRRHSLLSLLPSSDVTTAVDTVVFLWSVEEASLLLLLQQLLRRQTSEPITLIPNMIRPWREFTTLNKAIRYLRIANTYVCVFVWS